MWGENPTPSRGRVPPWRPLPAEKNYLLPGVLTVPACADRWTKKSPPLGGLEYESTSVLLDRGKGRVHFATLGGREIVGKLGERELQHDARGRERILNARGLGHLERFPILRAAWSVDKFRGPCLRERI